MAGRYYSILHDIKHVSTHPSAARDVLRMPIRARRFDLLSSTFMEQQYFWLYSRIRPGTTLIDIGANIGDTAIYFAMNPNVRRVMGYEPVSGLFKEAGKNIGSSPYGKRIRLINEAMTPSLLGDALRGLQRVAIKCDCEGAEATMFDDADLSQVYAMQIEYHNCLSKVRDTLRKKGFRVSRKGPKEMGMVYATR